MIFLLQIFWNLYFIRKCILLHLQKQIANNMFLGKKEKSMIFYRLKKALNKKTTFIEFATFFNNI